MKYLQNCDIHFTLTKYFVCNMLHCWDFEGEKHIPLLKVLPGGRMKECSLCLPASHTLVIIMMLSLQFIWGKWDLEKLGDFCKVAHLIEWQRWEPKDLAVILCCIRELACYHVGRNSSLSPRASSFPFCGPLPSRSIILITVWTWHRQHFIPNISPWVSPFFESSSEGVRVEGSVLTFDRWGGWGLT